MIYYVDIDETICRYEGDRNYPDAVPMQDRIETWGAKHHGVVLGKPHYDIFIDDKVINSEVFFGQSN